MRKRILISMFLLLCIAAIAWWVVRPRMTRQTEQTAKVRRGTIEATVDALGRVQPVLQVALSVRVSGPVRSISVQPGDDVVTGTILLELDTQEIEDGIEQAEQSLAIRRRQLEAALQAPSSPDIALAKARLRRANALRHNTQQDYDAIEDEPDAESSDEALDLESAKLEYEVAEAELDRVLEGTPQIEIERLEADVAAAELLLRQATRRLQQTRIRAPFHGTVLSVEADVGENVYGFAPLVQFADLSQLEVLAEIDEIDVASVREGQVVQIRFDAFAADVVEGRVARLLPSMSGSRGATTYGAIVRFDAGALPIQAGMGANLIIVTHVVTDALLIPRRAVRQVGRHQVVTVVQGTRRTQVQVTTGLSDNAEIQVFAGLKEGQLVSLD